MLTSERPALAQSGDGPQGFRKHAREELRIERRPYQGHDLVHVRVWERRGNDWRPTPKGLSLSPALWEAILPEIEELTREALEGEDTGGPESLRSESRPPVGRAKRAGNGCFSRIGPRTAAQEARREALRVGRQVEGRPTGEAPLCWYCRHRVEGTWTCAAFPDGIPEAIADGDFDHRAQYRGDEGIRFEPRSDMAIPAEFRSDVE